MQPNVKNLCPKFFHLVTSIYINSSQNFSPAQSEFQILINNCLLEPITWNLIGISNITKPQQNSSFSLHPTLLQTFLITSLAKFIISFCLYYCTSLILWKRRWHPTPVLLPGKSHGQRSLIGCSPWGH